MLPHPIPVFRTEAHFPHSNVFSTLRCIFDKLTLFVVSKLSSLQAQHNVLKPCCHIPFHIHTRLPHGNCNFTVNDLIQRRFHIHRILCGSYFSSEKNWMTHSKSHTFSMTLYCIQTKTKQLNNDNKKIH